MYRVWIDIYKASVVKYCQLHNGLYKILSLFFMYLKIFIIMIKVQSVQGEK